MSDEASTVRDRSWPAVTWLTGLPYRNELAIIALLVIVSFSLPAGLPLGIAGLGAVQGATLALQALGLVLVFRSDRIINFSQASFGLMGGFAFTTSLQYRPLYRWIGDVCPPCLTHSTPAFDQFNFWLSMVVAVLLSAGVAWVSYMLIVRRFRNAPRLVATVVTIFLNQLLFAATALVLVALTTSSQRSVQVPPITPRLPYHFTVLLRPAIFHAEEITTFIAAILVAAAVAMYLRRSSTGIAIRASAENRSRAETLGVRADAITARVWLLAGALSGLASVFGSLSTSADTGGATSTNVLIRILLIAVLARFASLVMTVVGAFAVAILQSSMQHSFAGASSIFDGSIVILIGTALLLQQRAKVSRSEQEPDGWQGTRELRPIPRELRGVPSVRSATRWTFGVVGVVVVGFPWAMSPNQTNLGALAIIYGIIGLSLLVLTGWAGQISLGQFGIAAVGGYVAVISGLPFLLALPIGALAGSAVALLLGIPALKLRGLHLAVITLAFAVAVPSVLLSPSYLGKHLPLTFNRPVVLGLDFNDQRVFYYVCLLLLTVVAVGVVGVRRSRTGRGLIAARDNELAVQVFGVSLIRIRLVAFALSGFIAALGGVLLSYHQEGAKAENFPADLSLTVFLITIIGGLGGVSGPLLGAAYEALIITGALGAKLAAALEGILGLALLLFMPGGLAQAVFGLRDSALRRVAQRNRIVVPSLFEDRRAVAGQDIAPLEPKVGAGGASSFVPLRYTLDNQWALPTTVEDDREAPEHSLAHAAESVGTS